jgi:hypothetical protein
MYQQTQQIGFTSGSHAAYGQRVGASPGPQAQVYQQGYSTGYATGVTAQQSAPAYVQMGGQVQQGIVAPQPFVQGGNMQPQVLSVQTAEAVTTRGPNIRRLDAPPPGYVSQSRGLTQQTIPQAQYVHNIPQQQFTQTIPQPQFTQTIAQPVQIQAPQYVPVQQVAQPVQVQQVQMAPAPQPQQYNVTEYVHYPVPPAPQETYALPVQQPMQEIRHPPTLISEHYVTQPPPPQQVQVQQQPVLQQQVVRNQPTYVIDEMRRTAPVPYGQEFGNPGDYGRFRNSQPSIIPPPREPGHLDHDRRGRVVPIPPLRDESVPLC